jgi:hypothetical protein
MGTHKIVEQTRKTNLDNQTKVVIFEKWLTMTRSQVPCWTQVGSKLVKQRRCLEFGAHSQLSTLKGVEGCAKVPRWN